MGKYMNQYKELVEQRDTLKQIHQRLFNQYGSMMSEEAKVINKINWDISERMYDSDIEIALFTSICSACLLFPFLLHAKWCLFLIFI